MASESEQEKRENLADIVAEMRTRSREVKESFGGRPDGVENMLDIWADRIEAIDSADAWRSLYTPGNAAAMREALLRCREIAIQWQADEADGVAGTTDKPSARSAAEAVIDMEFEINAALSAPARNCDVGTSDEQDARFSRFCVNKRSGSCSGCPDAVGGFTAANGIRECALVWAQTPYEAEEGGAE